MHNVNNRSEPWNIYKQAVFPLFYSKGFQEIAFTAGIAAIMGIKAVAMQRTNNITQRIYIPIGKLTARMRAFLCTGKQLVPMHSNSNCFTGNSNQRKAVRSEINSGDAFGDLMPGGGIVKGFNG